MEACLKLDLKAFQNSFATEGSSPLLIFMITAYSAQAEAPMVKIGMENTINRNFAMI
jgi:hypothetical protein